MSDKKLRLDTPKIAISRESASDSAPPALKIYFFFNGFSQFESTRPAGAGAGAKNAVQRAPPQNGAGGSGANAVPPAPLEDVGGAMAGDALAEMAGGHIVCLIGLGVGQRRRGGAL